MSYTYKVIEDYPIVAYPMNPGETSGFIDVSGNGINATNYGTLTAVPPLVSGGGNAYIVNDTNGFSFSPGVFTGTDAKRVFTLEVWFKPKDSTGTMQVLGHNHAGDGILWNGDAITFTTLHGTAGACTVIYYPSDISGAFYIVAIHTESKNQLYVNGVLVAETEMTTAQQLAGYTVPTNPGVLYAGHAISGGGSIIVDSVAVYDNLLTETEIVEHYAWGHRVVDVRDIVSGSGGFLWTFTDNNTQIILDKNFNDDNSWREGITSNSFVSEYLYPVFNSGVSIAGTWTYGIVLNSLGTTLDGSKIEWDGDGTFTVETSVNDGANWTTCVNGREVPGISTGFSTTNKTLLVRVTFPSGLTDTTNTVLRSLRVKLYSLRSVMGFNNPRTFDLFGNVSVSSLYHQPIEMHDEMGLDTYAGYARLLADIDETPTATRTVEAWVKFNAAPTTGNYLMDLRTVGGDTNVSITMSSTGVLTVTGGTLYVNGAAYAGAALAFNQWHHLVFVASADNSKNLTLSARYDGTLTVNVSWGTVSVYSTALNLAAATQLYNSYLGITGISVLDTNTINITEQASPAKVYAFSWSISSAG